MYTKSDFLQAIANTIENYPAIAPLYRAGDPRICQSLEAMATMLSMLSSQIETAQTEQFDKTRDGIVLADAAMRGIVPRGTASRVRIKCVNEGEAAFRMDTGRTLIDSNGRYWRVETPATIAAGGTGFVEATQQRFVTTVHTVSGAEPFYAVEIPQADDDSYICSVSVSDANGDFEYRNRYVANDAGERIYNIEADDRQRLYVRFGYDGVVGWQPAEGAQITLMTGYTNGEITVSYESPFQFETMKSVNDPLVTLTMDEQLSTGGAPISMDVLRDMAKYPAVYQDNAVFIGEFGFLVRKHFPNLQFLSVWNETMEEQARGPSVDNVNAIFVACLSADGKEKTLTQTGEEPVEALEITESELTDTQKAIRRLITSADDSYKVRFFTPVISYIKVDVEASVPSAYLTTDVKAQIKELILKTYGKSSAPSRRGNQKIPNRDLNALLKDNIVALQDSGGDFLATVNSDSTFRPERWRFVDESSLAITVDMANSTSHSWGG